MKCLTRNNKVVSASMEIKYHSELFPERRWNVDTYVQNIIVKTLKKFVSKVRDLLDVILMMEITLQLQTGIYFTLSHEFFL